MMAIPTGKALTGLGLASIMLLGGAGLFRYFRAGDMTGMNKFICIGLLVVALPGAAAADRHCSFARQSAFYARELSAEAGKPPADQCKATMAKALARLDDARIELEICTCAVAEERLRRWFESAGDGAACDARAQSVNAVSKELLSLVETCF